MGERRSAVAIPIAFTVLRLALGPAMIAAALASGEAARPWLAATLCIGMASDFADGITARALRVQSVALRRFDSRTDLVFWACALGCVWVLSPGVMRELWWVVAALVALHAVATGVDRRRGGGTLAVRSYAAKAMGVPVFAAVLALLWTGRAGWIVWFTAAWVSAAEIDVVLIALLLPGWEGNVPSAWSAWRKRRAQDRQRDGGAAR